jgi:hypothetical protein
MVARSTFVQTREDRNTSRRPRITPSGVRRAGVIELRSSANFVRDNRQPTMKSAVAIEKQSMYPSTTMTGTGCDSSHEIITAQSPVGCMNLHRHRHRLSPETVSLSLVPLDGRPFHVRRRRAACPAISALNDECAHLHDLRPIPAERTGLQYRDDLILFHLLPSLVAVASEYVSFGHPRPEAARAVQARGGDMCEARTFEGPQHRTRVWRTMIGAPKKNLSTSFPVTGLSG